MIVISRCNADLNVFALQAVHADKDSGENVDQVKVCNNTVD